MDMEQPLPAGIVRAEGDDDLVGPVDQRAMPPVQEGARPDLIGAGAGAGDDTPSGVVRLGRPWPTPGAAFDEQSGPLVAGWPTRHLVEARYRQLDDRSVR